jgi:DNA-binding IclR family transcriptional regulator
MSPTSNTNGKTEAERGEGVAAVDRALKLLEAIAAADGPTGLVPLAAATGFHKSTILRLALSLQAAGLIQRAVDGRFSLGPAILRLGTRFQQGAAPAEVLLPVMRTLAEASGESVAFYVPAGLARVCLYRVESQQALRYSVQVGSILPLDQGSGGRVLAAYQGKDGPLHAAVRAKGHYHSDGERDPDVAGISVPVFREDNEIVGALTIAGPRQRLTPARVAHLLGTLQTAAETVSHAFGAALRRR